MVRRCGPEKGKDGASRRRPALVFLSLSTAGRVVDTITVPATVQAVFAARIDRLPPEDKRRLLKSAAIVGHELPFVLLQAHRRGV